MTDQSQLLRIFSDYARTISAAYDIEDMLHWVVAQTAELLNVGGAAVFLAQASPPLSPVAATHAAVGDRDVQRIALREGPLRDAYAASQPVSSTDLANDTRWPVFRDVMVARGVRSVAAIPMAFRTQRLGVLAPYRRVPGHWHRDQLELAQVLADMTSSCIVNARVLADTNLLVRQLQHALESRVVIEQAKGVLMERHAIDPPTAFARLRAFARNNNRRISDVAGEVLDGLDRGLTAGSIRRRDRAAS